MHGVSAILLELGNDEVYYVAFARHLQWSYFDHPPFVAWLIELSTFHFHLQDEFFIRLFPIVFSACNILIVYRMVSRLSNWKSAFAASLIFASSIYAQIIAGLFIMPDTAMLTFVLLATERMMFIVHLRRDTTKNWVLFGIYTGMAFLSKYHALFLWFGVILYALIYRREWLGTARFYFAGLITVFLMTPVLIWNAQHDFISFVFHSQRVGGSNAGLQWKSFARELFGSMLYNNPVVFVLLIWTLFTMLRGRRVFTLATDRMFLLLTIPLISFFLISSLFKETLPHWSAPAYTLLILPAGVLFAAHQRLLNASAILMLFLWLAGPVVIRTMKIDRVNTTPERLGRFDFTLDMYGWHQVKEGFQKIRAKDIVEGKLLSSLVITKWFPGGHLDHYVARPSGLSLIAAGSLDELHQFRFWYPEQNPADTATWHYYITTSHFYINPEKNEHIAETVSAGNFYIYKGAEIVQQVFIYHVRLKDVPREE